jgi:hypothetical protein
MGSILVTERDWDDPETPPYDCVGGHPCREAADYVVRVRGEHPDRPYHAADYNYCAAHARARVSAYLTDRVR